MVKARYDDLLQGGRVVLKKTLIHCSQQLEKPRQRTEWSSEAS